MDFNDYFRIVVFSYYGLFWHNNGGVHKHYTWPVSRFLVDILPKSFCTKNIFCFGRERDTIISMSSVQKKNNFLGF